METESRMVGVRGWGRGNEGVKCIMGTQLQFGKKKKFWRWMVVAVTVLKCH